MGDIDSLSDRSRSNYFFARTVIGREFAIPGVQASVAGGLNPLLFGGEGAFLGHRYGRY